MNPCIGNRQAELVLESAASMTSTPHMDTTQTR